MFINNARKIYNTVYASLSIFTIIAGLFLSIVLYSCSSTTKTAGGGDWVGTWSTAPQLVEVRNNPPDPGLTNNTLRQVVRVSLGKDCVLNSQMNSVKVPLPCIPFISPFRQAAT